MLPPLLSVTLVLVVLGCVLGTLTLFRQRCRPHPELPRKLLHIIMGLVMLALPWLLDGLWSGLLLASLSLVFLALVRVVPLLRANLGQVLHGVARVTLGEFCFVLGVTALWCLYVVAPPDPPERRLCLYLVPILLLTFADAVAGLVGVYWGRRRYAGPDGRSQEGSAAFFLCAVVCILLPLLLLADRAWPASLLVAVGIGCVLTFVEATIWSGLDNLAVPLLAYGLLVLH